MLITVGRLTLEEWQELTQPTRDWGGIRYPLVASFAASPASTALAAPANNIQ
jgi:hypothetical protein